MGKVLELSEDAYERLQVLAQQRQCTLEELIYTFLVDYEPQGPIVEEFLASLYAAIHFCPIP